MKKNLYHHKTDGGAEYLMDTFIPWKHNGKSGKEGRVTDKTRILIRLDGKYPELIHTAAEDDRADLLAGLIDLLDVCHCINGCAPDDMSCASNRAAALIARLS